MLKSIYEMDFNKAWGELLFQEKVYPFKTKGEGWSQLIPIDEDYSIYRCDDPAYSVYRKRGNPMAYWGHLCLSESPDYKTFKQAYLSAKLGS